MIKYYKSIFYNTLEELNATYKPDHPDVLYLKKKYGSAVQFNRIMHRKGVKPMFELRCFKICKEGN